MPRFGGAFLYGLFHSGYVQRSHVIMGTWEKRAH